MKDYDIDKIIPELYALVESACKSKNNAYGYGIWSHHILDVIKFSKKLAKTFNADEEIVEIAAILHDYAGIKNSENRENHHIVGAIEAENILKKYMYPIEKIELVKNCILNHRSSVINNKETLEEKCIASADAIAHINQIPSLFYASYIHLEMSIDKGQELVYKKIERDWNKLCEEGKKMIEEKYEAFRILFK